MKNDTGSLISIMKGISFGAVELTPEEISFYSRLNGSILELVRSLPDSVQGQGLMRIMGYCRLVPGQDLDFFRNYHVPSWSAVLHLLRGHNASPPESGMVRAAVAGQAMAMFLHSLDDHLCDSEMETTHLILLIRSQAWRLMVDSMKHMAAAASCDEEEISRCLDTYYSSISTEPECGSVESYLSLFRKQMATWTIVPFMAAMKSSGGDREYSAAAVSAYENFGRAWRILDDVNDAEEDLAAGRRSTIYHMLPEALRLLWDGERSEHARNEIISCIYKDGYLDRAVAMARLELEDGALTLSDLGLQELSAQMKCLAGPLAAGAGNGDR